MTSAARAALAVLVGAAGVVALPALAGADAAATGATAPAAPPVSPVSRPVLDRAVVRFYAPETGGTSRPRFIDERTLAFEARLESIAERPDGLGEGEGGEHYQERHVRAALEHHVGEELLASLAAKLMAGLPAHRRPTDLELARVESDLGAALLERLGGRARVDAAAAAEQLDATEIDGILRRQALAAWYLDRAVSPILQATDEQLREVFRTAAHPFRGRSYDEVRAGLARWFVVERLRSAESAFYQGARTRVTVIVTR